MATPTIDFELVQLWNDVLFRYTWFKDIHYFDRLSCSRCGRGTIRTQSFWTPNKSDVRKYWEFFCGYCVSLYNPETGHFPEVGEMEKTWLMMCG